MSRPAIRRLAAAVLLICSAPPASLAQDRPGSFDFYVLALSWSPSYCAAEGRDADRSQCGVERRYAFVVHGLWPQRERGWPEFCARGESRVPRALVESMLDIMPSPRLVGHEWRKHGACSGLDQRAYFDKLREARGRIAIPEAYRSIGGYTTVDPDDIEEAFIAANPGLPADAVAVTCDRRLLREVRICMGRDLAFRACPEVDRRSCRAERIGMPPSRSGQQARLD